MIISLIVAADDRNGIGANNGLMWDLPDDMKYFRQLTTGHHVLMGRHTYLSIPRKFRPLKDRTNLVLSRDNSMEEEGALLFTSIESAIRYAQKENESELFVIGGGQIYQAIFNLANRIYLTRVHHEFHQAEVFFPFLDENEWQLLSNTPHPADSRHAHALSFQIWERKA